MKRSPMVAVALFLPPALALPACEAPAPSADTAVVGATSTAQRAEGSSGVAGVSWKVPGAWPEVGPKPMRVATHRVPRAAGDAEDGELAIFFFGPSSGGGTEANLARWIGQMAQPDGSSSAQRAVREKKTINGIAVTTLDLPGTYLFASRPMSPNKIEKPGYHMFAAVVEAPGGSVFFKLTAPEKTADRAAFDSLLASLAKTD